MSISVEDAICGCDCGGGGGGGGDSNSDGGRRGSMKVTLWCIRQRMYSVSGMFRAMRAASN